MQRKLLFFDIDGTLKSDVTHEYPESTRRALALAKQNGHLLFINTGRPICNLDAELFQMGFDGFLCGCARADSSAISRGTSTSSSTRNRRARS